MSGSLSAVAESNMVVFGTQVFSLLGFSRCCRRASVREGSIPIPESEQNCCFGIPLIRAVLCNVLKAYKSVLKCLHETHDERVAHSKQAIKLLGKFKRMPS